MSGTLMQLHGLLLLLALCIGAFSARGIFVTLINTLFPTIYKIF